MYKVREKEDRLESKTENLGGTSFGGHPFSTYFVTIPWTISYCVSLQVPE